MTHRLVCTLSAVAFSALMIGGCGGGSEHILHAPQLKAAKEAGGQELCFPKAHETPIKLMLKSTGANEKKCTLTIPGGKKCTKLDPKCPKGTVIISYGDPNALKHFGESTPGAGHLVIQIKKDGP